MASSAHENMARLIQRIARLSAFFVFFIILFVGLFSSRTLEFSAVAITAAKAAIGGGLFWILGVVLGDIAIKGLLESLDVDDESKWGGDMLSHFAVEKEKMSRAGMREAEPAQTEPAAGPRAGEKGQGK